jgi:hypothetical protein
VVCDLSIDCHFDVIVEKTAKYIPLVTPSKINAFEPVIARHNKPKKAVIILE